MNRLARLDERLVPVLAKALRELLDGLADRRTAGAGRVRSLRHALRHPRQPAFLRRLDDRYAASGPLALLREVPQLGLLLVAALFLGGAGVALARSGPSEDDQARQVQDAIAAGEIPTLGPEVGTSVQDYIDATGARVADLNGADPDQRYTALVSLRAYARVEDVAGVLADVEVKKVFARAQPAGPRAEVLQISVQDLLEDTRRVFAATAVRKARDQQDNLSQARSITSTVASERAFRDEFTRQAAIDGKEAAAYRTGCACVFAFLVDGTARELADLLQAPGVRAVEPAVAGATELDVEVTQLFLPEDIGIVPSRPMSVGQDYGTPGS